MGERQWFSNTLLEDHRPQRLSNTLLDALEDNAKYPTVTPSSKKEGERNSSKTCISGVTTVPVLDDALSTGIDAKLVGSVEVVLLFLALVDNIITPYHHKPTIT